MDPNLVISTPFLLMFTGALLALARKLPGQIWRWTYSRVIITVEVQNTNAVFDWISAWLAEQPYSKRARNLTAEAKNSPDGERLRVLFTPAPGNHIIRYKRRLLWIERERKEPTAGAAGKSDISALFMQEIFYIRVLGWNQDVAHEFIEDARKAAERQSKQEPSIYTVRWGYWQRGGPLHARPLESVILPAGMLEDLIADVQQFLNSQDWYRAMGIPYRRGFMFEGLPRTGKSSAVSALAGFLGIDLYLLTISGEDMNDERLMNLLSNVRDGSIILCEDIDSCLHQRTFNREDDNSKGVTFSGFLNALDGVAAREGCMIFLTTNHKEKLDQALIGPGRVDREFHFDYADHDQIERMFLRFFPGHKREACDFAALHSNSPATMANVQQHLQLYRDSPRDAVLSLPAVKREAKKVVML